MLKFTPVKGSPGAFFFSLLPPPLSLNSRTTAEPTAWRRVLKTLPFFTLRSVARLSCSAAVQFYLPRVARRRQHPRPPASVFWEVMEPTNEFSQFLTYYLPCALSPRGSAREEGLVCKWNNRSLAGTFQHFFLVFFIPSRVHREAFHSLSSCLRISVLLNCAC